MTDPAVCPICHGDRYASQLRTYGDQQYHGYYYEKCDRCAGTGIDTTPYRAEGTSAMTDPSELIERLEKASKKLHQIGNQVWPADLLYKEAFNMIRTLAAERDAAIASKPAAPKQETARVRVAVWVDNEGGIYQVAKETDVDPLNDNPTAWITADVPIPGAEITGTVIVAGRPTSKNRQTR